MQTLYLSYVTAEVIHVDAVSVCEGGTSIQ
jgi:hypothetical protein